MVIGTPCIKFIYLAEFSSRAGQSTVNEQQIFKVNWRACERKIYIVNERNYLLLKKKTWLLKYNERMCFTITATFVNFAET